jgi:hypothetical protein
MIEPHAIFQYVRADEVAETFEGVSDALYARLWNDVVPLQKAIPNREDSGPADHVGHEHLASHWNVFTDAERLELNAIAERNDPK